MRNKSEITNSKSLDYIDRVNRAIDFILGNLDQSLKLEVVANAAGFSPFHFHRIFRSLVGESLAEFVKRVRLERSLALMSQKNWRAQSHSSLTKIAFACGFSSSADFSRCFKQRYGVPPSQFDVESFRISRREEWQSAIADPEHQHLLDQLPTGTNPDHFEVQRIEIPPRTVAYLRVMDSYQEGKVPLAAQRLVHWADERNLADGQWLGYMWDDPEIVAYENCRYDVGLEIPASTPDHETCGEIGRIQFPAMQVAEINICGGIDLEMRALDWLFKTWLPSSGFLPIGQPCFEVWQGKPFAHGLEHFELAIHLPIERG